ncbi:NaeI family type II restriction endonuclease [Aquisalinus flavus]|uniref:Type II restriction enzyme NaeI domain-containing protein n=1 Tax=Aquisalinus flavus TaxID=1526572 RepID=A0A8J2V6Q4_9PROT|nr:NaeI family type II restriction endonuclease [Aquisalinus flavus]MBD0426703.1 hypothetical protein [Aquisalinus flavus]UNE46573.1 hypothetical protein FF099_00070 [Aquisalinus flavus]GGC95303.1 hypothetical protein GCM10011342_00140 [Aquisalinus flavus]
MSMHPLSSEHPDYEVLSPLVVAILKAAGGLEKFKLDIPVLFRTAIDEVIDAPRTNRFTLNEIEKTEKTYLGTKIEILLRNHLKLPKGNLLDLNVNNTECDIKHTMHASWSIPQENYNHPAILLKENEKTALMDFGLVNIRPEYLRGGMNQDRKTGISAANMVHVWWILKNYPYPPNFWEKLPPSVKTRILNAGSASLRIAELFRQIQEKPITRTQIHAISQQHDYMKRMRKNGGARDILHKENIYILWGSGDKKLIKELGLGTLHKDEFVSVSPKNDAERKLITSSRHGK